MSIQIISKELRSKISSEAQIMMQSNIWAKSTKKMKIYKMLELVYSLMILKLSNLIISTSIILTLEDSLEKFQEIYLDNNLKLITL
jgi:hypothetical protein